MLILLTIVVTINKVSTFSFKLGVYKKTKELYFLIN